MYSTMIYVSTSRRKNGKEFPCHDRGSALAWGTPKAAMGVDYALGCGSTTIRGSNLLGPG